MLTLRAAGTWRREDGEHGHEPERVGDVVALGVGEAANEGEDERGPAARVLMADFGARRICRKKTQ